MFINNKLALDLGGVHVARSGVYDIDARATEFSAEVTCLPPDALGSTDNDLRRRGG
ncbi:MAG: hypothetical protein ABI488_03790 [Polyangiaceae bacterium]